MLKKLLTILLLLVPVVAFAATTDFTANSNITVPSVTFGSGTASMIILNGSTAQSWTFSSGTFTVTNAGTFNVGSSDSSVKSIQFSSGGTTLVCAENTTPGTSYATAPTAAGTYTITPSATTQCTSLCSAVSNAASYNSFPTCGAASCNAGYTLSGSGASATCVAIGGGGPPGLVGSCSNGYTLSGGLCYPPSTTVPASGSTAGTKQTSTSVSVSATFSSTLKKGIENADVKRLQTLLASDAALYPEGLITGFFGRLTEQAVQRFQTKYNIVTSGTPDTTGYGLVGPQTRAKLAEVFGAITSAEPTPSASNGAPNTLFSTNLSFGTQSSDVYRLQQLLATDISVYPEGIISGYFGSLTRAAVQRFQLKYGIVASETDSGYGLVGPKTRAKLQEVFK